MTLQTNFVKYPTSDLDYKFDWKPLTNGTVGGTSDWLEDGETITTHTVTADTGITVDAGTRTDANTSVTIWISGGTLRRTYKIYCYIETSLGRKDTRWITVEIDE